MITARKWETVAADLLSDVKRWSQEKAWRLGGNDFTGMHASDEAGFQPDLWIYTQDGSVVLGILKGSIAGADGRVDLMDYPTLRRVMLIYKASDGWRVRTDSGIDWPNPWSQETFYDLVERLVHGK